MICLTACAPACSQLEVKCCFFTSRFLQPDKDAVHGLAQLWPLVAPVVNIAFSVTALVELVSGPGGFGETVLGGVCRTHALGGNSGGNGRWNILAPAFHTPLVGHWLMESLTMLGGNSLAAFGSPAPDVPLQCLCGHSSPPQRRVHS